MSTNLPDSIQKFISETIPDTQHIPVIYEWLEYVWTDRRQGSLMVFETWDATFVNNLVTIAHYGLQRQHYCAWYSDLKKLREYDATKEPHKPYIKVLYLNGWSKTLTGRDLWLLKQWIDKNKVHVVIRRREPIRDRYFDILFKDCATAVVQLKSTPVIQSSKTLPDLASICKDAFTHCSTIKPIVDVSADKKNLYQQLPCELILEILNYLPGNEQYVDYMFQQCEKYARDSCNKHECSWFYSCWCRKHQREYERRYSALYNTNDSIRCTCYEKSLKQADSIAIRSLYGYFEKDVSRTPYRIFLRCATIELSSWNYIRKGCALFRYLICTQTKSIHIIYENYYYRLDWFSLHEKSKVKKSLKNFIRYFDNLCILNDTKNALEYAKQHPLMPVMVKPVPVHIYGYDENRWQISRFKISELLWVSIINYKPY